MCYPCRTIPLVNQRKPWNARTPTGDSSVSTIAKVSHVLLRRLRNAQRIAAFIAFLCYKMVCMMGIDPRLIAIPVALGGLGLVSWTGRWCVKSWRPDPPAPNCITNRTEFRTSQEQTKFMTWA